MFVSLNVVCNVAKMNNFNIKIANLLNYLCFTSFVFYIAF